MVDAIIFAWDNKHRIDFVHSVNYVTYVNDPKSFPLHMHTLCELYVFVSGNADYIVESNRRKNDNGYPKGIQEKTLHLITDYLELHSGEWVTGDQIAGETGLTVVTVRRYMSFLMDSGKASGEMNYETGGRPCMTYCLKNF